MLQALLILVCVQNCELIKIAENLEPSSCYEASSKAKPLLLASSPLTCVNEGPELKNLKFSPEIKIMLDEHVPPRRNSNFRTNEFIF